MKNSLFITLSIVLMFFLSNKAFAQTPGIHQTLRITPVIIQAHLIPGKPAHYHLTIENLLNVPIGIGTSIAPLDASDEDNGIRFDQPVMNNSLPSWTSLTPSELLLNPHAKDSIDIQITVPKGIKSIQKQAIIFLSPIIVKQQEKGAPTVISKIGVLVLGDTETITPNRDTARIQTFDFGGIFSETLLTTNLRVENTAKQIISSTPHITLQSIFGGEKTYQLVEKRILPGKIRRWKETLGTFSPGIYQVNAAVSLGNGVHIEKTTIVFVGPIKTLALIVMFFILILLGILGRHRMKKAFHVLFSGKAS